MHTICKSEAQLTGCSLQRFYSWDSTAISSWCYSLRIATLRFAQRRKIALKKNLRAAESCAVQIIWIVLIPRLGSEVTFTRSRKRVENWFSNFNAISLALGAVSFKRGHVLEGGQVPADVCARQPICFRMLPKSRADAESGLGRLAIELKRGLFSILMQTNSWIWAQIHDFENKIDWHAKQLQIPMPQPNK